MTRLLLVSVLSLGLSGCGLDYAQRQYQEAHARMVSTLMSEAAAGRMSPYAAADIIELSEAQHAAIFQAPVVHYDAPAHIDYDTTVHSAVPEYVPHAEPPAITYERPRPVADDTQIIPSSQVSKFMPGFRPDGTVKE